MKSVQLCTKSQKDYYEIRIESIGGLGANLCTKMLGELGIRYLGLNSAGFSSYGSEKTGTPVKGYIRYSAPEKEIRDHSPVAAPDLLCIFHDALLSKPEILDGCTPDTEIVINTLMSQKDLENYFMNQKNVLCGTVWAVAAQKIAIEENARINVVMLAAMARAMGFAALEDVNKIVSEVLGKKYPEALNHNIEAARRGYEEVKIIDRMANGLYQDTYGGSDFRKNCDRGEGQPEWGYETAPIGGINTRFGNSVANDLSPSRTGYIPVFIRERCIHCGLCDSTCPDMVFQFEQGEYKGRKTMVNRGLDYYHCKGCLRCVSVCPTQALVKALESEYKGKKEFIPNRNLIRLPDFYEKTGADSYVTSESYLTERRIKGGEV